MSESRIEQAACRKILKDFGITSIKLTPDQSTGYPDRLFWMPGGKPLLIEFKRPGERPRAKQLHILCQLIMLGYEVRVCSTVKQAVLVIKQLIIEAAYEHC